MKPICVVKIGGALVDSIESLQAISAQIDTLAKTHRVLIVHGGGPQATRMAAKLGHQPTIVEGRRVTTALDLEIIQATVCGTVNSQLVATLVGAGAHAVGISGASASTVVVTKRPPWQIAGESVDFGFVGDIRHIDPTLIELLLRSGYVPVMATIGIDDAGRLYNVNADTTAAAIAASLQADRFCIVTDSGGLLKDGSLIGVCDETLFQTGKLERWITDGMLVKLQAGFAALDQGVECVEMVSVAGIMNGAGTQLVHSQETVEAS
ncbi:MAG: acetylglutamate kinase [Rhodothermales bacterium]